MDAVPGDAGPKVAQRAGREPAGDQAEHALERLGREVAERIGAADEVEEGGNVPAIHGHAGHDLLGQDVEAAVGHPEVLDVPLDHRPREGRGLEQVGRRLGDQPPLAHPVDDVPGPADALQPAGDVPGRLHLADEVDVAHVDAQLERRRRDHAPQAAAFELLLGRPPLLQAQAAVVGAEPGRRGMLGRTRPTPRSRPAR